jgi:hypothetical protein
LWLTCGQLNDLVTLAPSGRLGSRAIATFPRFRILTILTRPAFGSAQRTTNVNWLIAGRRLYDSLPRVVRRPRPEHLAVLIALVAIALRLYRRAPTWSSSDAADLPDLVTWVACHRRLRWVDVRELALYKLGGVQPLVLYAQMMLVRLVKWRTTDLTWESTTIAVSAASTYTAFLFGREVAGAAAGLSAAVLLAICPMGISLGRHLGAPWAYEEFFQYLIAFLLVASARTPERRNRIGLCFALAAYFWVGNQMLGILPVLAYGVAAGFAERKDDESAVAFFRRRFTTWSAVPAASLCLLLYCTFRLRAGHLAHALFDKRHNLGFYYSGWIQDASVDVGAAVVHISLALVVLGVLQERRWLSQRHLPLVLFLAYSAPFWCAVPPGSTLTRGYVMYGVSALLIAATTAAFSARLRLVHAPVLLFMVGCLLVVGTLRATYRLTDTELVSTRPFQGTYADNNGIKTAAMWIRSRGVSRGAVFSDASGGRGLEPSVVDMYTQRRTYGLFDGKKASYAYARFAKEARNIDYLLVGPANSKLAALYFPMFAPALEVIDGQNDVVLSVYTKQPVGNLERLSVADGDRRFEATYSMMCTD